MPLESGSYLDSLVPTNPVSTDGLAQADDHMRLIKSTLKNTFPNISGPVTPSHTVMNTVINGAVPVGVIVMWSGSIASIPSGWALCDGTNGTPDLVDRFIVGAGSSYAVDATGGASTTTLSEANLPAHTHTFSGATTSSNGDHSHTGTTSTDGNHNHNNGVYSHLLKYDGTGTYSGSSDNGAQPNLQSSLAMTTTGAHSHTFTTSTDGAHTHTVSGTTDATGSGTAFDNRPPYYALAYIMRISD